MRHIFLLFCLIFFSTLFAETYISPNGVDVVYPPEPLGTFSIVNYDFLGVNLDGTDCLGICNYNHYVNSSLPITSTVDVDFKIGKPSGLANGNYLIKLKIDGGETHNLIFNLAGAYLHNVYTIQDLSFGLHYFEFSVNNILGDEIADAWDFPASEKMQFSIVPTNTVYQNPNGDELYHLQNNFTLNGINQPVLFVDGDDPVNSKSRFTYWEEHLTHLNMDLSGKDIYLLMFRDCRRDVRQNAMSTLMAMQYVHSTYAGHKTEGTVVAGFSLGGIVSRYALAFAEEHNLLHYCSQYIAIDSPQRGSLLNAKLQQKNDDINHTLNLAGWAAFEHHGTLANQLLKATGIVKQGINSFSSKQLIRTNKYAGASELNQAYIDGTYESNKLFSEINEEDHIDTPTVPLNSDPLNLRPGFPYKQNDIKCLAVSNGSLTRSGNINGGFLVFYFFPGLFEFDVGSEDYDTQPGSTTGFNSDDIIPFDYDPIISPTRSALYLKPTSKSNPNVVDNQLDFSNYTNIQIPQGVTSEDYLTDHSYFDQVMLKQSYSDPEWGWTHCLDTDYSENNTHNVFKRALDWSFKVDNRAICYISGNVHASNYSNISISAYVNGILLPTSLDFNHVNSDGTFSVPYTLLQDADVRLVFEKSGCMPTFKNVHIDYNEATSVANSITGVQVTLFPFNYNAIIVAANSTGSFETINAALEYLHSLIDSGLYDHSPIKIYVGNGTYTESLNLDFLTENDNYFVPSFTITGNGTNVIIDGDNAGSCISMNPFPNYEGLPSLTSTYIFSNLKFTSAMQGIRFTCSLDDGTTIPRIILNIVTCSFYNLGGNPAQDGIYGAGIQFEGAGSVTYSTFTNNVLWGLHPIDHSGYGALFLKNETSSEILVDNNTFSSNNGKYSGAVGITGAGNITFSHNNLTDNYGGDGNALKVFDAKQISIKWNLFVNNYTPNGTNTDPSVFLQSCSQGTGIAPMLYQNNTIFNNLAKWAIRIFRYTNQGVTVKNNVFSNALLNGGRVAYSMYAPATFTYNILYNTKLMNDENTNYVLPTTNSTSNPNLSATYDPIWNTTIKSICIDKGDQTIFDDDGSPSDIGGRLAITHDYENYDFVSGGDGRGIKWMSFPVLDRITSSYTVNGKFFGPIVKNQALLDRISYKPMFERERSIYWSGETLVNGNEIVNSMQGYKIFLTAPSRSVYNPTSGYIQSPHTVINLEGNFEENWVGYFCHESVDPLVALSAITDRLVQIKAQYWCLDKDVHGNWICNIGGRPVLNYEDMVILKADHNCSFSWNNDQPVDPKKVAIPQNFVFTEKDDYTPLYIQLNTTNNGLKPSEIGLYVNDVCKGASVVIDSLVQICAYLDAEEVITPENSHLVFYYNTKSAFDNRKTYTLNDKSLASTKGNTPYYYITISDVNSILPIITETLLAQNYPNPFNPNTTISYQMPKDGKVTLSIFNIKGQVVKNLVNTEQVMGTHSIVWDGKDDGGKSCASGVYYYRLNANDKCLTKKMLMLK